MQMDGFSEYTQSALEILRQPQKTMHWYEEDHHDRRIRFKQKRPEKSGRDYSTKQSSRRVA